MSFEQWLYAWRVRLRELFCRDRVDRELDDELRHHVTLETEARRAQGAPPHEARRQALTTLGGLEAARNHVRDARFGAALEHVLQDVRYVLRVLRRNPGFTATTVLTLTLAISATTATFSVVDAVLLQPPPFAEPERLVTLWETDPEDGNQPAEVASANFLDWREQATSFEHVAALDPWSVDLTGADTPEVLYGWQVTEEFFEALGTVAARGRTFAPDEHRPGSGVVVMTDELWRRRFDGDPAVVGRTLVLDDEPHTVVGVLAPSFELRLEDGRSDRDIFLPKAIAEYERYIRNGGWWQVIARTRPDVTLAEAQSEMDAVAARLAADHPRTNASVGARVIPLQTRQVASVRPVLLLLWGAVVFVLLIACVNVANLMLARYARREQEFAVRAAVGGGPGRLLRQLLTESVVIAALGGLGGLVATAYALDLLVALMPADVPRLAQIAVNQRLLGFTAGLVVLTALAFGCAPAVRILRQDVNGPLTRGHRTSDTPAQQRLRRTLVAAEVALALVLLVGAGLLMQSFVRLVNVDLGFAPQNTAVLQVFHYGEGGGTEATPNFFRETLAGIRALPGVAGAGAVSAFPLSLADLTAQSPLILHDRPPPPPGEEPSAAVSMATPGYLDTMRIPLRAGRWFDERDDAEGPAVAVVNETLARQHWPDRDPLTRQVSVQVSGQALVGTFEAEIVGVVGTVRPRGFDSPPRPEVFIPHAQAPNGAMTYVVRTVGDPAASIPAIQSVVWDAAPYLAFYSVATVEQLLADTLAARRFTTLLLALFGAAALALAGLGIYGVIAVATSQRTREIGLRLAMGGEPRHVVWMVVRGAVGLAATGVAVGLLASLLFSQTLTSLLFAVAPFDAATLAGVSLLLLAVAAAAAWSPARRASRVDPLVALRTE
ncbi:MAG: ABC transporter permease [Acidobacteria bacterium]|nr:ABC transporter permease [Acidobacteriota bacterium]